MAKDGRLKPKGLPVRLGSSGKPPTGAPGISSRGTMAKKTEPPKLGGPNATKRTGR